MDGLVRASTPASSRRQIAAVLGEGATADDVEYALEALVISAAVETDTPGCLIPNRSFRYRGEVPEFGSDIGVREFSIGYSDDSNAEVNKQKSKLKSGLVATSLYANSISSGLHPLKDSVIWDSGTACHICNNLDCAITPL